MSRSQPRKHSHPASALPAPTLPDWLDQLVPYRRYRMQVGAYRMHVMEAGDPDGQPVLCVHGNPTWGFLYRKVVDALDGSGLRIIMPDLIGLGFSDKPKSGDEHQLDAHGAWLGALVDALDLQSVTLVGQDWGGPVGFRAFADRSERLSALVVLNTVIGPPKPGFKATAFHRFAAMPVLSDLVFRGLSFPQINLNMAQGDKSSIDREASRAYRYPIRGLSRNVAPLALARMVPSGPDHPSIAALQRCFELVDGWQGPAAIVWGDKDPILGKVRSHVERTLPQARVTRTSAGHFLQEEVPEQIGDAIRYVCG